MFLVALHFIGAMTGQNASGKGVLTKLKELVRVYHGDGSNYLGCNRGILGRLGDGAGRVSLLPSGGGYFSTTK